MKRVFAFSRFVGAAMAMFASAANVPSAFAETALRFGADSEGGAPYIYQHPAKPDLIVGFEVDFANELGRRLGAPMVHVQNQWDALVLGLNRGNYDLAINGLEITEERKREVHFSVPYFVTAESLVIRRDTSGIERLSDCRGKRVGTLKGALAEEILKDHGGIEIVSYEADLNAFGDLENGRLDAVLIDAPIAVYRGKPNPKLRIVGGAIGRMEYGVALRMKDRDLLTRVNHAIGEMRKDGTLTRIYQEWGLWDSTLAQFLDAPETPTHAPKQYEEFLSSSGLKPTYWSYLPLLGVGAIRTLELSILGMILAVGLGLALALMRRSAIKPLAWISIAYVELVRGTPLLIQLYLIFYGLPHLGVQIPAFWAAILGLGLNYAASEAENFRAGIQAVPRGQWLAAYALGLNRGQTYRHVVLPQAVRIVLPPMTNDFIALIKDSSLVSVITMVELTKVFGQLAATHYDYLGIGLLTAAMYFVIGLPFVQLARAVERRWAQKPGRRWGRIRAGNS